MQQELTNRHIQEDTCTQRSRDLHPNSPREYTCLYLHTWTLFCTYSNTNTHRRAYRRQQRELNAVLAPFHLWETLAVVSRESEGVRCLSKTPFRDVKPRRLWLHSGRVFLDPPLSSSDRDPCVDSDDSFLSKEEQAVTL